MKPVFNQELVPNTQSLWSSFAFLQSTQGTTEASRKVCTSVTVFGLALSLGASGALFSGAEAADSVRVAYLPSEFGFPNILPSYGSDRPSGAAANYHTVSEGETIWDIAKHYGIAVEDIKTANGIIDSQSIQAGQVLKVPSPSIDPEAVAEQPLADVSMELATAELTPGFVGSSASVAEYSVGDRPTRSEELELTSQEADDVSTQRATRSSRQLASLRLSTFVDSRNQLNEEATAHSGSKPFVFEGKLSDRDVEIDSAGSSYSDVAALPEVGVDQPLPLPVDIPQESVPDGATVEASPEKNTVSQPLHRIQAGETIWSIAFIHGVTPETLRQANGLANPNIIFPGDTLVIPVGSRERELQSTSEARDFTSSSQDGLTHISPTSEDTQLLAEERNAVDEIEPKALVEARVLSSDFTDTDAIAVEGSVASGPRFSLENSSIAALPSPAEREIFVANTRVEMSPSELAAAPIDFNPAAESDAVDVEVDVLDEAEAEVVDGVDDRLSSTEQLLAAAPLGSEVYAPIVESPEGRVVSPDLPALPAQEEYLPEAPNRFNGYMWPAQGVLTSGYGWRWGRMHQGVDIAGPVGTPIFAAAPGFVVRSGWNSGGYGNVVDIRHPDGSLTRYAHNSRLLVEEGQEVQQGQQIAEMGSTGYSTGPHLHFEIHLPDQGAVNPMAYLPGQ